MWYTKYTEASVILIILTTKCCIKNSEELSIISPDFCLDRTATLNHRHCGLKKHTLPHREVF